MMILPRFVRVVGPSLFMILSFACVVAGQTETATVSGLVTDRTGAPVPGAEMHLLSVERGTETTTTTNDAGIYVFPTVHPGQYQISVQKQGFKQVDLLGLIVNVQDHIEQNFHLEVGSIAESVTVEAGTPLINTQDATVSTVVDRQFADNLPLNGRSFQTLIQLTPGVVLTPSNVQDSGQFSINGQRAASNYWMVDGVSANIGVGVNSFGYGGNGVGGAAASFSALGGTNSLVSVDALQEFRIQTSTYAPEFGRTPGGQISIVTRSGTNQFHGTLFDYLRNDVLDANNWFASRAGLLKPKERQNDFGGTFSGPILKDRTFFFFSYEGLRLRLPQTTLTTVPDASFTPGGTTSSRQNAAPAMQPYLNAFPLPNPNSPEMFTQCTPNVNGCPASGQMATGIAQFNASYSNPASLDAYSMRADQRMSDKLNIFGRYNYSPSEIDQRGFGNSTLNTIFQTRITTQTATIGTTWGISPTTVNDFRFNYSRASAELSSHLDNFGGSVPLTSSPFPNGFTFRNGTLFFSINSLQQGILQVGPSMQSVQRQINIVDSLSAQTGRHSVKLGVDFRRLSPQFKPTAYKQFAIFGDVPSAGKGNLQFSDIISNLAPTFLFRNLGLFAQDTWRATSRLSLTYGLRWDIDFVPQSTPNFPAVTGFNLNNLSNLALAATATSPYKTTWGNFAPRLGLAYQLTQSQDWQTVLRAGAGIFYDLASSEVGNRVAPAYPFGSIGFPPSSTFPLTPALSAPAPITRPSPSNPGVLEGFDPNLKLPYTVQWNTTVEQALGKQQRISASYIGSIGRRLLGTVDVFPLPPSFSQVFLATNAGTSDYNALQVQFQRRLSHGLQALGSYTWSHSIDTGSAGSTGIGSNILAPSGISANRGPSDFDVRSGFSVGMTYTVPSTRMNAFTNAILRGWSLQNVIQAHSATPVDITDSIFFKFGAGYITNIRPDVVPGKPLYLFGPQYPSGKAFNPAAFTNPPTNPAGCNPGPPSFDFPCNPARQGNLGRNALRGFGATQWDFAIHRDFPIHESLKLQFRAEMFNVLNHPNFGPPSGCFGAFCGAPFGVSTQMLGESLSGGGGFGSNVGGGGFSPLYQLGPRSIQLALKLIF